MQEKQGMTDEEFHEKAYEYARTELERIYAAVTIYRELNMEFSDEEFSRGVAALAENYGYDSSSEFVDTYGEDYIREVLVTNKVEEYLLENNTMVVMK
jgi:FKBP-type peptidyl-prolyl cis-trans isomerase (trigger factor)